MQAAAQDIVLEVRGLTRRGTALDAAATVLDDVSFDLRRGEILGLAGLVGAGRTETVRAIFGADSFDSGEILIDGQPVTIDSPIDAIQHGIGFVPEDRKEQGLVLGLTVRENVALPNLDSMSRFGFVRLAQETLRVKEYVQPLQIRTPSLDQRVLNLSGGNQQKVVISKWLMLHPRILIMDEPTRGIDVGAKAEIYRLMNQLVESGVSIIMISSELPEVLAMSDRVVCMARGRVTGILTHAEATPELVMRYCTLQPGQSARCAMSSGGSTATMTRSPHTGAPRARPSSGRQGRDLADHSQPLWRLDLSGRAVRHLWRAVAGLSDPSQYLQRAAPGVDLRPAGDRHDLCHPDRRHRPVRRLGAGAGRPGRRGGRQGQHGAVDRRCRRRGRRLSRAGQHAWRADRGRSYRRLDPRVSASPSSRCPPLSLRWAA